jgi:primosomal protein N'
MKKKSKNALSKFLVGITIAIVTCTGISSTPVKAETEDVVSAADTEETGFSGNLLDVLGLIVNSFLHGKIPNFEEILSTLFDDRDSSEDNTPSKIVSKILTNQINGSFSIQQDEAEAKLREEATKAIESATLSKDAQKKMKETVKKTEDNVIESVELAEQAAGTDVTQRILRKMSKQEALNAIRDGIVIRQNQQAQVDRAIENTLAKEQLRKLAEADSKERTRDTILENQVTLSTGLVSLPGLIDIDRTDK